MKNLEEACELMHDAYEKAAAGAGWETNPASRKPWSEVPEPNKATMRIAVAALVNALAGEIGGPGAYEDFNRAEATGDKIRQAYHAGMHDAWASVTACGSAEHDAQKP